MGGVECVIAELQIAASSFLSHNSFRCYIGRKWPDK